RREELETLTFLTGKGYTDWDATMNEPKDGDVPEEYSYARIATDMSKERQGNKGILFAAVGMMSLLSVAGMRRKRRS
ncbi:MAG: hypothetical protein Q8937_09310, partial [Bacteroidota bacterium]|nr:hypothetical protein [Bacteroidota bacterium]